MKKLFCLLLFLLLIAPAADAALSHHKKFEMFAESVTEAANKISWSGKHNFQDVEFVSDEMNGEETVYARAWYADYYLLIRSYTNKTWAKSSVSIFWTSSEELTFANGIKVGASMRTVRSFFGNESVYQVAPDEYAVYLEAESDAAGSIIFSTENNRITAISYNNCYFMTTKMMRIFDLYDNAVFAAVAGERVNVRDLNEKVLFQVNKSKRDCIIVTSRYEDKYRVIGRVNDNYFKPADGYIAKKFLKVRKLKISERNLYISQYIKNKK